MIIGIEEDSFMDPAGGRRWRSNFRFESSDFRIWIEGKKHNRGRGNPRNKTAREETPSHAKGDDDGAKYFTCGASELVEKEV